MNDEKLTFKVIVAQIHIFASHIPTITCKEKESTKLYFLRGCHSNKEHSMLIANV